MSYDEKPNLEVSRRTKLVLLGIVLVLLASVPVFMLLGSCRAGNCL